MMKLFPKRSKKGITLVESVVAVVVLAIFAIGIITLLTSSGVKIQEISGESAAYAAATQKLDLAISSISNGAYVSKEEETDIVTFDLDALKNELGLDTTNGDKVEAEPEFYVPPADPSDPITASNVRGWYLTLTYKGVEVQGFVSNSEGVFDS